jgi:hypothetical protein
VYGSEIALLWVHDRVLVDDVSIDCELESRPPLAQRPVGVFGFSGKEREKMKRRMFLSVVAAGLLFTHVGFGQEKSDGGAKEHQNSGSLFGSMFGNKGAGDRIVSGPHDPTQMEKVLHSMDLDSRPHPSPSPSASPSPSPAPPPPPKEAPTPHADHHGARG